MQTEIWILIVAGMLWAMHDIVPWRKAWTWLPAIFLGTNGRFNIDGYHFSGMLMRLGFYNAGWVAAGGEYNWIWLLGNLVAYLVSGAAMNMFYHFIFMKSQYWFKGK